MRIVADLHTHTIASGHAYSTLQEMIRAAGEKGLELVAITDHGPAMMGGPSNYYFGNLRILPRTYLGVEVLYGVEANIVDTEGTLDLPERYLKKLDIVLAGLHEDCIVPGSVEDNTKALLNAMKNPLVDIIVHPGNPAFAIDIETVVNASRDYGVALEVNNSSLSVVRKGSYTNCCSILEQVRRLKSPVSLGSDSHWAEQVGGLVEAVQLLEKAGITEDQVLNTSLEKIRDFLRLRKKAPASRRDR